MLSTECIPEIFLAVIDMTRSYELASKYYEMRCDVVIASRFYFLCWSSFMATCLNFCRAKAATSGSIFHKYVLFVTLN